MKVTVNVTVNVTAEDIEIATLENHRGNGGMGGHYDVDYDISERCPVAHAASRALGRCVHVKFLIPFVCRSAVEFKSDTMEVMVPFGSALQESITMWDSRLKMHPLSFTVEIPEQKITVNQKEQVYESA